MYLINDEQEKFLKGFLLMVSVFTIASIMAGIVKDVLQLFNLITTILYTILLFLLYLTAFMALLALTYIFMKNHDIILGRKLEDKKDG